MDDQKDMQKETAKEAALETIINSAVKLPLVKVSRNEFLTKEFADYPDKLEKIIASGPVQAGISREQLSKAANKLIITRTSQSSVASFAAGIPGGFAMAATIPADVMQFFGMSLRLAQELAYLYGAEDMTKDGDFDDESVRNRLILYCGVMFGVSGAISGVRVLSSQIAKVALKKLPQKALTKTFWYPIIKQIGKAVGIRVTKSTAAQGISKAIPVIGGVISGGLNFASMLPMAKRLYISLDKACFDYSDEELEADISEMENISSGNVQEAKSGIKDSIAGKIKGAGNKIGGMFRRNRSEAEQPDDIPGTIKKLSELKDAGILTQEEFDSKKADLLAKL